MESAVMERGWDPSTHRFLICAVQVDELVWGNCLEVPRNIALPDISVDGRARVCVSAVSGLPHWGYRRKLVVRVDGVPSDASVLIRGKFSRTSRGLSDSDDSTEFLKDLRGNGILVSCCVESTLHFTGTVSVYSLRKPLLDHMKFLSTARQHGVFRDVVLHVAGEKFPAHKLVLSSASSVFRSMFTGEFKEAKELEVKLTHTCSAAVFSKFLDSLYTGWLPNVIGDVTDLVQLLELGSHYMLDPLKEEVTERLMKVNAKDAMAIVKIALENPVIPEKVLAKAFDIALVDGDNATSIIRIAVESRVVPEAVLQRAINCACMHWERIAKSQVWSEFQETHPSAAMVVKAVARQTSVLTGQQTDDDSYG